MKKLVSILLIAVMALGFTGCGAIEKVTKTKVPDLNVMFEADSVIKTDNMEVTAHMKRYGNGYWTMTISKPDTLAGLEINYGDETVTAKLGESEFDMEKSKLNSDAIFKLIFDTVDHAAAQKEMNVTEEENGLRFSSENDNGKYSILLDKDSKMLKGIDIPDHNISVNIHNFKLMQDTSGMPSETAAADVQIGSGEAVNAADITGQPAEEVVAPQETVLETSAKNEGTTVITME